MVEKIEVAGVGEVRYLHKWSNKGVAECGTICNIKTKTVSKSETIRSDGVHMVKLFNTKDWESMTVTVGQLVCHLWCNPVTLNLREIDYMHKNGNQDDLRAKNLHIVQGSTRDKSKYLGKIRHQKHVRLINVLSDIERNFNSVKLAAEYLKVSPAAISKSRGSNQAVKGWFVCK